MINSKQEDRVRAMLGGRGLREIMQRREETQRRHAEEIRAHKEHMSGLRERNRPTRGRINRQRWVVERTGRESEEELVVEATEEDNDFSE